MSENFIINRKYNHLSGFNILANAVRQVSLSGDHYFSPLLLKFSPDIPEPTVTSLIRKILYPERVCNNDKNVVGIYRAKDITSSHPFYLRAVALKITHHISHIREVLIPAVSRALNELPWNYESYLGNVLGTDNIDFIINFSSQLLTRLNKIRNNLNLDNVYLCALNKDASRWETAQGPVERYSYQEILTREERRGGTFASTLTDKSMRIFINTDKLYYIDAQNPDQLLQEEAATDVITTLIHEASHVGTMATDIVYFPRKDGTIAPILDSIGDMKELIRNNKVIKTKDFNRLNNEYFTSISVYKDIRSHIMEADKLVYIIENDPAYLAHLLLHNADGLAILARDLYLISEKE